LENTPLAKTLGLSLHKEHPDDCDLKHKPALAAALCFVIIVVLTVPIPLPYSRLLGPTGRKDAIFLSPITPLYGHNRTNFFDPAVIYE
jgi:hypothetical protein